MKIKNGVVSSAGKVNLSLVLMTLTNNFFLHRLPIANFQISISMSKGIVCHRFRQ